MWGLLCSHCVLIDYLWPLLSCFQLLLCDLLSFVYSFESECFIWTFPVPKIQAMCLTAVHIINLCMYVCMYVFIVLWVLSRVIVAVYKISNEEVLAKVEKDRQIMQIIEHRQHHWIGHFWRHQNLLLDIVGKRREDLKEEEGRCRCYICRQKMVMWHWSETLKTDGDGVIERYVKNLLYSRLRRRNVEVFSCICLLWLYSVSHYNVFVFQSTRFRTS